MRVNSAGNLAAMTNKSGKLAAPIGIPTCLFSEPVQLPRTHRSSQLKLRSLLIMTIPALINAFLTLPAQAGSEKSRTSPSALVEHDCAPWDGPAFGVWIPAEGLGGAAHSWIYFRIWQRLEDSVGRFSFPNDTLQRQKGAVTYFLNLETPQKLDWQNQSRRALIGNVRFTRVSQTQNVLGEVDFTTDQNVRLRGSFSARWLASRTVGCG